MDWDDVVLVGGVGGVGLGVVEERGAGLDAGGVGAEGVEEDLGIHVQLWLLIDDLVFKLWWKDPETAKLKFESKWKRG